MSVNVNLYLNKCSNLLLYSLRLQQIKGASVEVQGAPSWRSSMSQLSAYCMHSMHFVRAAAVHMTGNKANVSNSEAPCLSSPDWSLSRHVTVLWRKTNSLFLSSENQLWLNYRSYWLRRFCHYCSFSIVFLATEWLTLHFLFKYTCSVHLNGHVKCVHRCVNLDANYFAVIWTEISSVFNMLF